MLLTRFDRQRIPVSIRSIDNLKKEQRHPFRFHFLTAATFPKLAGKVVGLFLIFCLGIPVPATFTFLNHQKKQIKEEIKQQIIAGIDKKELVLLKFAETDRLTQLNWEHSSEFEYKGDMYDVVETSIIADTTYYWVWCDLEETELNKLLTELVSLEWSNNPKNLENRARLQNFFNSLYFSAPAERNPYAVRELNCNFYFCQKLYPFVPIPPTTPPPELG